MKPPVFKIGLFAAQG